ncbi:MAG: pyridine nucleotide-disulfide oxidoreductase/dicluster-binding protein [Anaerovoracaceae bacterium]|jgi:Fe-S oxidoreductase
MDDNSIIKEFYDQFDNCIQHEIPMCSDACPFKMDILDLQQRVTKGRLTAVYKNMRNAMAFPGIVSRVCPAYCEQECIRKIIDTPVQIRLLEQSVIAGTKRKTPNAFNLPAKKERIAVVGAGLSGLGFTIRMASKKYPVTVFEKSGEIGGTLSEVMERDEYMAEFELQMQNEEYQLELNHEISDLSEISDDFDVIYVATGKGGRDFGVPVPDGEEGSGCSKIGNAAVFLGGRLCGRDLMFALADGLNMSNAAVNYLKTGNLEYPGDVPATRCIANEDLLVESPAIKPGAGDVLSKEECAQEAARCIRCKCDACRVNCNLVDYLDKWPLTMRDEIFVSTKAGESLVSKNPAKRLINTCEMCGLCAETCPSTIELGKMIKNARYILHRQGKTPGGYHQFWIRDMEFSNGEYAALTIAPEAAAAKPRAFFPGCWLGSADPDYVIKPYLWLQENFPGTGLLLRCCTIPADWSGNQELHLAEIEKLKEEWESIGSPELITACPSCMKHLNEYLPQIPIISIYEIMAQEFASSGLPEGAGVDGDWAVFDPCQARHYDDMKDAVRQLSAMAVGGEMTPLEDPGCCGYGGLGQIADPGFIEHENAKRRALSEDPYIVYCVNCRDIFRDRGKEARHILDVLFNIDCGHPTETQRRKNKVITKERLMKEVLGEEMTEKPKENRYKLKIDPEVQQKMDSLRLLESDICETLEAGEEHGRRTIDPESGNYKCYRELGNITCWVEYAVTEDDDGGKIYDIRNLYTHRMSIKLEEVWNGKRTETDL